MVSALSQEHVKQNIGHSNFPAFDTTYFISHAFWLLISFGLFYLFIARVIVPLVGGILEIRRDRIASDLDNAARLKSDAVALLTQSDKLMQEALYEFKTIVTATREKVNEDAKALRKENQARFASLLEKASLEAESARIQGYSAIAEMAKEVVPLVIKNFIHKDVSSDIIEAAVRRNLEGKA